MKSHDDLAQRRCWLCSPCVLISIFGVASIALLGHWVYLIVAKVMTGAGQEFCCTFDGYRFTYLAVFVVGCCYTAVILAVVTYALYDWWQWRSLERKYGARAT